MESIESKIVVLVVMIAMVGLASAFKSHQDPNWAVPASFNKMKNPIAGDSENVNWGKSLYSKHCKSCHGKSGEGDGTKAEELETFPGDFTTKEFQSQSDGAIYYKSSEGRDDMPSFKKKIANDEDIWSIIHYLRTLKTE